MTPRVVAIILCMLGFVCGLSSCEELERTANSDRQPHTYEGAPLEAIERHPGEPLFGISSFPGGFSAAEQDEAFRYAREYSQVYVVQRDNGIPWAEAFEDSPYPKAVMDDWQNFRRHRPDGAPLYLALAPLNFDRKTLIDPLEGSSMPRALRGKPFDDPNVMRAYLNHVRRAVEFFDPDFLNIGVEAGEIGRAHV